MGRCLTSVSFTRDTDIARVLAETQRIAVLGASDDPARPSYQVMEYLIGEGYEVFPVNPSLLGRSVLGRAIYADLSSVAGVIDMVDVFRRVVHLPGILDQAAALGVKTLWTQLGIVDHDVAQRARAHGMTVVMDRCPAIEGPRLKALGLL